MVMKKYANYYLVIIFGAVMALGVFLKLLFNIKIDSDWFWFLTGVAFAVEGAITLKKQRQFDKKYKIIER
jgi:uncharacterized membrane protein YfcA